MAEVRATTFNIFTGPTVKHGGCVYLRLPSEWEGQTITAFIDQEAIR